jgi:predicted nucleic acid-binding protein
MGTDLPYFDTTYIVRLYLEDAGYEKVRALAAGRMVAASWHARAEVIAAMHRAFREGRLNAPGLASVLDQFAEDLSSGLFFIMPFDEQVLERLESVYRKAPADVFLRAADALHLACAAEHGFDTIHSNDRKLLAAAPLFGVRGVDVIGA